MKIRHLFLCFGLFYVTQSAFAQTQQDSLFGASTQELLQLFRKEASEETVSSASQKAEKLDEVPATMQVITRQQILERGYQDISDVLKDLQGVDYVEHAGRYGEFYTIRGIPSNDRFLILINGRKLNAPSGTFLSVGNSIAIRMAERIEVVYGAASIVYGSDAFSAIINIITSNNQTTTRFQAGMAYSSFNTKDIFAEIKVPLSNKLKFTGFARGFLSNGYVFPDEKGYGVVSKMPNPPLSNQFEQPIRDYNIFMEGNYNNFRFGFYRQHFDEGNSRGLNPAIYVYNSDVMWTLDKDMWWVSFDKKIGRGMFKAEINYTHHALDPNTRFLRYSINNNVVTLDQQFLSGTDSSWRFFSTYTFDLFNEKLKGIAGIQLENTNSIPAYGNDEVLGKPLKMQGTIYNQVATKLNVLEQKMGAFMQFTYRVHSKVLLTTGARYDYSKLFDESFNPRLALIIKPTTESNFKLIYATAFQAPSLWYKYEQFANAVARMVPNTQQPIPLANQTVQAIEAEFDYIPKTTSWQATMIGFYNKANNLIERVQYSNSVPNPVTNTNTNGLRNENIGEQYAWGVTTKLQYTLNKKTNIHIDYTYTKAEQKFGVLEYAVPRISTHKIGVTFTTNKLFDLVNVSLRARYFSDVNPIPNSNSFRENKKVEGFLMTYCNIEWAFKNVSIVGNTEYRLGNDEQVGIFNGGIYTPTIPQPRFVGRIGIEIRLNR